MKYYDHKHINGVDLRRLLARPEPPQIPWRMLVELAALVAAIAAIIGLLEVMQ
jgi:hypothetical protein